MPHHGSQDFRGQLQKSWIKVAADRRRIFRYKCEGFDQILIQLGTFLCDFRDNLLATLIRGKDHKVLAEFTLVILKLDWNTKRTQLTMASGNGSTLYASYLKRNYFFP